MLNLKHVKYLKAGHSYHGASPLLRQDHRELNYLVSSPTCWLAPVLLSPSLEPSGVSFMPRFAKSPPFPGWPGKLDATSPCPSEFWVGRGCSPTQMRVGQSGKGI